MSTNNLSADCVYSARLVSKNRTRAVLRLVWPSILLLFIERWRHLADSN